MENNNFFAERDSKNTIKLRAILRELPYFCNEFFMGIENNTTVLTRLNYAYDLRVFFNFLSAEIAEFHGRKLNQFTLEDINKITATHLEMFLSSLSVYERNNKTYRNDSKAKSRKLCTIRSFLKYFFNKDKIAANVSTKVELPKTHEKEIVRLEVDEVVKLINQAESPGNVTKMQRSFNMHTRVRDVAILTLFLGTGIRVSELVGINIEDIDFKTNAFKITRKGGSQCVLYFSEEVADALLEYLEVRRSNKYAQDEPALFLSLQNKRITVRAVEKLVKKYALSVTPLKKITPHKLRSTYGTNLYRETGDIYIVADVLGHKDVNTTKKHYAAISEDIRRNAASKVKLRDKNEKNF